MPLPSNAAWVAFDPIDLDLIDWEDDPVTRQRILDNTKSGWVATLWIGGAPLCCAGVADRRGGMGEAWTLIDEKRRHQYPLILTRSISRALDIAVKSLCLGVVNMYVQFSKVPAIRWAKALGFKLEGEIVMYEHPRQNHFIFARRY